MLYFLNGYRYHKSFNRFEFQALEAILSKKKLKIMLENESTLLKLEKTKIFNIFVTTGGKKSMQYHLVFKKIREIIDESLRQIRENFGIGR